MGGRVGQALFGAPAPNRSRGAEPGPRPLVGVNKMNAHAMDEIGVNKMNAHAMDETGVNKMNRSKKPQLLRRIPQYSRRLLLFH